MKTRRRAPAKRGAKKRPMDKRTSQRLARLAGKVLKNNGACSKAEAKRLAACVLSQTQHR